MAFDEVDEDNKLIPYLNLLFSQTGSFGVISEGDNVPFTGDKVSSIHQQTALSKAVMTKYTVLKPTLQA